MDERKLEAVMYRIRAHAVGMSIADAIGEFVRTLPNPQEFFDPNVKVVLGFIEREMEDAGPGFDSEEFRQRMGL